jgi:radical SAM protein with 4Fe4S-binding SPASM domain
MKGDEWRKAYLRLCPKVAIKNLETPFVYHIGRDELYEIDDKALSFLTRCDGASKGEDLTSDDGFVEYCLDEGILEAIPQPGPVKIFVGGGVYPSLRYLELHLLHRCNLKCAHCYLGSSRSDEMFLSDAVDITRGFSELGGLRLLISGGEPLLYRDLRAYIEQTSDIKVRRILFSNGTLINKDNARWLNVDEVQFSLDGWIRGHESLRGTGTFKLTMRGIFAIKEAGIPVSFSTMIHRDNLDEFDRMRDFMRETDAVEWGIDVPAVTGLLSNHKDLTVPYKLAAPFLEYAYGGGYHGASEGYACGRHLMAVMPDARAVKCGFYGDKTLGDARKSLKDCWLRMEHTPIDKLECRDCSVVKECRGGCRFRAPHFLAPDPAMCCFYGIQE